MNRRRWCRIFAICLFIVVATYPGRSDALTIENDQQFNFAETLFNSRQYQRAAEEYQRFAFFFPNDSRQRPALFKAGQAFLLAKDSASALDRFKALTAIEPPDAIAVESYFMIVECYLDMNDFTHAVLELNNLIAVNDDIDVRDRAYHRLGWLHIELTEWQAAQKAFARISAPSRARYQVDDLERELGRVDKLPSRSPALAGTLSILPGAGQFYCNRYEDALIAFAVNLGLFWAAHDAFDQDQYALGSLLSFVGLGFYAGNIYSAVGDAHKFNQQQKQNFGQALKRHLVIGLGPTSRGSSNGILLGLQVPF